MNLVRLKTGLAFLAFLLCAFFLMRLYLPGRQVQAKVQFVPQTILQVRGPEWMKFINMKVTLKGFYYDGSIPMIIDDFNRVVVDMKIPKNTYIPVVGPVPPAVKSGFEVSVTGLVARPSAADPRWAQKETLILKIESPSQMQIVTKKRVSFQAQLRAGPQLQSRVTAPKRLDVPLRYAVLVAGGSDEADNHIRYWNDLKTMYAILLDMGYWKENIYVVYADGTAKDDGMSVSYSASRANIRRVFDDLARKMRDNDSLYIMLNDHGAGFLTRKTGIYEPGFYGGFIDANGDEEDIFDEATWNMDMNGDGDKRDKVGVDEALCLWGEDMTDDEFAAQVNKITHYEEMIIQMKQCFSGGFVRDLTGPRRTIMSSCAENEISSAHKKIVGDEVVLDYGEFTYWYFAALLGKKPDDPKTAVNADDDKNGYISLLEAYNYARSHDVASETPFFEDDGVRPGHSGVMPSGGDGKRAANILLKKMGV